MAETGLLSVQWERPADAATVLKALAKTTTDGSRCRIHIPDVLLAETSSGALSTFGDTSASFLLLTTSPTGEVVSSSGSANLIRDFVDRAAAGAPATSSALAIAFTRVGQRVPIGLDGLQRLASGATGAEVVMLQECGRVYKTFVVVEAAAGRDGRLAYSARAEESRAVPARPSAAQMDAARAAAEALVHHLDAGTMSGVVLRATIVVGFDASGKAWVTSASGLETGTATPSSPVPKTPASASGYPGMGGLNGPSDASKAAAAVAVPSFGAPALAPFSVPGAVMPMPMLDPHSGGMGMAMMGMATPMGMPLATPGGGFGAPGSPSSQGGGGAAQIEQLQRMLAAANAKADLAAQEATAASSREAALKKRLDRVQGQVTQLTDELRVTLSNGARPPGTPTGGLRRQGSGLGVPEGLSSRPGSARRPASAGGNGGAGGDESALGRGGRAILGTGASGSGAPSEGAWGSGGSGGSSASSPEMLALEAQLRAATAEAQGLKEQLEAEVQSRLQLTAANQALVTKLNASVSTAAHTAAGASTTHQAAIATIRELEAKLSNVSVEISTRDAAIRSLKEAREADAAALIQLRGRAAELETSLAASRVGKRDAEGRMKAVAEAITQAVAEAEARVRDEAKKVLQEAETVATARCRALEAERDQALSRTVQLQVDLENAVSDLASARKETSSVRETVIAEAEAALAAVRERYASDLEEWTRQRAALETALSEQRADLTGAMAQRDRVAVAAMEDLRQEVLARYTADIEALKNAHQLEMAGLQAHAEVQLREERARWEAETSDRVMTALRQAEEAAGMQLEMVVNETLNRAKADLERALQASAMASQQEVEKLTVAHNQRVAEMQAAMQELSATYNREVAGLKAEMGRMIPLSSLDDQRNEFESRATAAMTEAVGQAVEAVRTEAQAAIDSLAAQLEEARGQGRAAVEAVLEELERTRSKAERTQLGMEDTLSRIMNRDMPRRVAELEAAAKKKLDAAIEKELANAERAAASALQAQAAEHHATMSRALDTAERVKSDLEAEVGRLRTTLGATEAALAQRSEALMASETRCAELEEQLAAATVAAKSGALRENELQMALAEQARQLSEAWDQEKAALEAAAQTAITNAVTDALADLEVKKGEEMESLRQQYTDRLLEAEREAREAQNAQISALEKKHREALEKALSEALADRDDALGTLAMEKQIQLEASEARAGRALREAQEAHERALTTLGEQFEGEKRALAEAAAQDIARALEATQNEMSAALAAAEAAWQERVSALLLEREAQEQERLAVVAAQYAAEIDAARARYECILMGAEEARSKLLDDHAAALREVVQRGLSEAEQETVAALGVFNQEWQARLNDREQELINASQQEIARLRDDHARELKETVQRLEQQRAAALEAIIAESAAEREAMTRRHAREMAAAVEEARIAAEARMAAAMAEAAAERDRALAEVAARAAQERAAAIAAVREQANAEHEEAMDALRMESDRLLAGIEGAMVKLRDERDAARQVVAQLQARVVQLEDIITQLEERIDSLKKAGGVQRLLTIALAARYASFLRYQLERARQEAEAALAAQAAEFTEQLNHVSSLLHAEKERGRSLLALRATLQETLTGFKRETVLEHKVKTMEIASEIASLADTQTDLTKQHGQLLAQLSEMEGSVRTIEREMGDLAKQSVIGEDGSVNVGVTRKKKRLDRDMDAALARLADRRSALEEIKRRLAAVERERASKEDGLRAVEADLMATLVQQQRALMATLTNAVVPPGTDPDGDQAFLFAVLPHLAQQPGATQQQQQQQTQQQLEAGYGSDGGGSVGGQSQYQQTQQQQQQFGGGSVPASPGPASQSLPPPSPYPSSFSQSTAFPPDAAGQTQQGRPPLGAAGQTRTGAPAGGKAGSVPPTPTAAPTPAPKPAPTPTAAAADKKAGAGAKAGAGKATPAPTPSAGGAGGGADPASAFARAAQAFSAQTSGGKPGGGTGSAASTPRAAAGTPSFGGSASRSNTMPSASPSPNLRPAHGGSIGSIAEVDALDEEGDTISDDGIVV